MPIAGATPAPAHAASRTHPRIAKLLRPLLLTGAGVLLAGCAVGPDYVRPAVACPPRTRKGLEDGGAASRRQPAAVVGVVRRRDAGCARRRCRRGEPEHPRRPRRDTGRRRPPRKRRARASGRRSAPMRRRGRGAIDQRRPGRHRPQRRLSASWEPDLWGGVRRGVEAGEAGAQASADDLAAARLSIQAAVAQDYLALRYIDVQRELYAAPSPPTRGRCKLTQAQYAAGVVLRSDVALAETPAQVDAGRSGRSRRQRASSSTRSPSSPAARRRALLWPPLARRPRSGAPARRCRAALPSELLERRPDIAAAERRAAAANASIGVARAAYYPSLLLERERRRRRRPWPRPVRYAGPGLVAGRDVAQTLFDGGLRAARTRGRPSAAYDVAVAQYKETVLGGFQQVEDDLASLRMLDQEAAMQDEAVAGGAPCRAMALAQYRGGTAIYLDVVTAQTLGLVERAHRGTAAQPAADDQCRPDRRDRRRLVAPGVAVGPAPAARSRPASTSRQGRCHAGLIRIPSPPARRPRRAAVVLGRCLLALAHASRAREQARRAAGGAGAGDDGAGPGAGRADLSQRRRHRRRRWPA